MSKVVTKHRAATTCTTDHIGHVPEKKLAELPESQASGWRHKCAACAYSLGFKEGSRDVTRAVAKDLDNILQKGKHVH